MSRWLALKGGLVYTLSGTKGIGLVKNGVILVREGRIAGVEREGYKIPGEYEVIDVSNKVVLPGLVDAHTHLGIVEEGLRWEGSDANEMTDPVTPHLRVIDGMKMDDPAFRDALEFGITTVGVLPGSANPIGGLGAAVKTYGEDVEKALVRFPVGMKMAFGENPVNVYGVEQKKSPMTRMAVAALIREWLSKAKEYSAKKASGKEVDYDIKLEALEPVVRGFLPVRAHAHRYADIFTAVRIAREFGLKLIIEHGTEAYRVADLLASENIPVVHGPLTIPRHKPELRNLTLKSPKMLAEAGVKFSLTTDALGLMITHLPITAALAVREGLPYETALRAITVIPAEILGVSDRIGSIEPGKDADIVVFDGDPLDLRSRVKLVLVNGEIAYSEL